MKLSREYRISQLKDAVEIFSNSFDQLSLGKLSFFNVLGGQIRALIVKGGRQLNPLFLNLCLETGYQMEFYSSTIENFPKDLPQPDFHTAATFFSIEPPTDIKMKKYHIVDWLDTQVLRSLDKVYTGNEFLRMYSEKHGGAHYDPELTQKELFLKSIQIGSDIGLINSDDKVILEFAKILFQHMKNFCTDY